MEISSNIILTNAKKTNWFGTPINQFHIFSLRKFFSNLVNIQLEALVQLSNELSI